MNIIYILYFICVIKQIYFISGTSSRTSALDETQFKCLRNLNNEKKINESDSIKICGDYERRVQNQMRDYFKISGVTNINFLSSDSENANDHVEFQLQQYGFNSLLGAYCSPDKKI